MSKRSHAAFHNKTQLSSFTTDAVHDFRRLFLFKCLRCTTEPQRAEQPAVTRSAVSGGPSGWRILHVGEPYMATWHRRQEGIQYVITSRHCDMVLSQSYSTVQQPGLTLVQPHKSLQTSQRKVSLQGMSVESHTARESGAPPRDTKDRNFLKKSLTEQNPFRPICFAVILNYYSA